MPEEYEGRLELTWTNKHLCLLAAEDGTYEWVPSADYRVAEVRLLDDVAAFGEVDSKRASDNLLIRGDALSALTSLAKLPEFAASFVGKVKLVYLDPPFNTQQSFLQYDDALEHSVWLTMMRDRLVQIKDLLADDGSVWVHLDDAEMAYCRVMMDEVFGRNCFVACITWRSTDNSNNDAQQFSQDTNYILVYARNPDWSSNRLARSDEQARHYANPDNDPRGPWFDGNPLGSPNPRENLRYDVVSPTTVIKPPPNGWRWKLETLEAKMRTGEIRFSEDGRRIIRRTYLADQGNLPPSTLWADIEVTGSNRQAKYELKRLFNLPSAQLFNTPKPERLMERIIQIATDPGDLVLDCFLGSATTAAVAHKLGRRWVGIERSRETIDVYALPRLSKVIAGEDAGGITESCEYEGGGGFRVLDVAASMFEDVGGLVLLADWATNGKLQEATAAQLQFAFAVDAPFCGRRGRRRLAVIDGLVNEGVVRLLASALDNSERLVVCGTAIDPAAGEVLRDLVPGSSVRKIPSTLLDEYRRAQWVPRIGAVGNGPIKPEPVVEAAASADTSAVVAVS